MSQTSVPSVPPSPPVIPAAYLDGVRTKRLFAFLIDGVVILGLSFVAGAMMVAAAIPTMGYSFGLAPVVPFIGVLYNGLTISGSKMSTWGMRVMDLRVTHRDGSRPDFIVAAGHALLFWILNSILTPLILVVSFFSEGKRTLHDLLTGLVVTRSSPST